MKDKTACKNCRHWNEISRDELYPDEEDFFDHDEGFVDIGHCRRFPPQIVHELGGEADDRTPKGSSGRVWSMTVWPVTYHDDFCGEFESNLPE